MSWDLIRDSDKILQQISVVKILAQLKFMISKRFG